MNIFTLLGGILRLDLTYGLYNYYWDDEGGLGHQGAGPHSSAVHLEPGGYTESRSYGDQSDAFDSEFETYDIPIPGDGTYGLGAQ